MKDKKNNQVVKSNRLNEHVQLQVLSLPEIRLVQLAVIDARETNRGLTSDTPLRISGARYAEMFNTTLQNAYQLMQQAEEQLFERKFSYIDSEGIKVKSRWISQVRYLKGEGSIELIFSPAVVKEITRLDGKINFYTEYTIEQTAPLENVYSIRLYEMLIQWRSTGSLPICEYERLKGQLGVDDSKYRYKDGRHKKGDFKVKVLQKAVDEINRLTDLTVRFQNVKKGTSVYGYKFSFHIPKPVAPPKTPSWQTKGLTIKQIGKIGCKYESIKEFVGANNTPELLKAGGAASNATYTEVFESWKPLLGSKEHVNKFKRIQEFLDRQPNTA